MTPPHTSVPPRKVLSLKLRVRRFFADHPDEELTAADFRSKFNCSEATRRWIMVALGGEGGELESVHVIRLRSKGIARDMTAAAALIDAAQVPTEGRSYWDGEKIVSAA
jgi:hypothetical protein